jgi:NAD(P)-dependent dehydrogenase (short-subunit alcohol dehydrogenase family)
MGRLDGKVALISGGARGQGAAEVKLFVREGAQVVFGDVLDDEGRQVEAEVRSSGGAATYVSQFAHFFRSSQNSNTLNSWGLYDYPTLEES